MANKMVSEIKKIHVVHVVQSLDVGGMENGVVNIANKIDKNIFKLSICCLSHIGTLEHKITDNHISLFSMNWEKGLQFALFLDLAKEFKKRDINIVHTHGWLSFLYGSIAGKIAGIPVLINGEHGTFNLNKKRRIFVYRLLSLFVNKFITVSSSLRKELVDKIKISSDKIIVIPNGVDTERYHSINMEEVINRKNRIGIPMSSRVIGSVGRLEPVKNYEMLINAFSEISHEFPMLYMLLVGDGSRMEKLEKLAWDLGLSNKICFLGQVNNTQDFIPLMDIFILTSYSEGMSNTILEAMSCSKPIIATDVGGNRELILEGKNGLLIGSGNVNELVVAIKSILMDDNKISSFGINSRIEVENNHSIDTMVLKYQNVYMDSINIIWN